MNAQEIEALIRDASVSDNEVLRVTKEYTADKHDEKGEILPMTEEEAEILMDLGTLLRQFRPHVMEKLRTDFLEEHTSGCSVCQALKKHTAP